MGRVGGSRKHRRSPVSRRRRFRESSRLGHVPAPASLATAVHQRMSLRLRSARVTPTSMGSTLRVDPVALLKRLAVLIPRPRINLVLYYGLLAPRAPWRAAVPPLFLPRRGQFVWAWRASIWHDPVRRRGESALSKTARHGPYKASSVDLVGGTPLMPTILPSPRLNHLLNQPQPVQLTWRRGACAPLCPMFLGQTLCCDGQV